MYRRSGTRQGVLIPHGFSGSFAAFAGMDRLFAGCSDFPRIGGDAGCNPGRISPVGCCGNDAVGKRFEHSNHAKSLAEYIWRYGLFEESVDGTGRVARHDVPYSLRDVVAPVAAKGHTHLRYALIVAGHEDGDGAWPGGACATDRVRSRHAAEHRAGSRPGVAERHPGLTQQSTAFRSSAGASASRRRANTSSAKRISSSLIPAC